MSGERGGGSQDRRGPCVTGHLVLSGSPQGLQDRGGLGEGPSPAPRCLPAADSVTVTGGPPCAPCPPGPSRARAAVTGCGRPVRLVVVTQARCALPRTTSACPDSPHPRAHRIPPAMPHGSTSAAATRVCPVRPRGRVTGCWALGSESGQRSSSLRTRCLEIFAVAGQTRKEGECVVRRVDQFSEDRALLAVRQAGSRVRLGDVDREGSQRLVPKARWAGDAPCSPGNLIPHSSPHNSPLGSPGQSPRFSLLGSLAVSCPGSRFGWRDAQENLRAGGPFLPGAGSRAPPFLPPPPTAPSAATLAPGATRGWRA